MPDLTLNLLNAPNAGPLTLVEKQDLFTRLVPGLLTTAHDLGFTVSFGECWRSNEEAARLAGAGLGIKLSLHCDRLAIDLILRKNGVLQDTVAQYQPLGLYWEAQSQLPTFECCWGGRFTTRPDAYHFSVAHNGRK